MGRRGVRIGLLVALAVALLAFPAAFVKPYPATS
jgi:hypothetical protein